MLKIMQDFRFIAFAAGMAGALFMNLLLSPTTAQAARSTLDYFLITSPTGAKGVETFVNDGQPGQFFYGEDGQPRIQLGTYTSATERGQPLISLSEPGGKLRMIFRLAGPYNSPVIIMKDITGADRMVMGLDLKGSGNPFLSLVDQKGQKHNIFGDF